MPAAGAGAAHMLAKHQTTIEGAGFGKQLNNYAKAAGRFSTDPDVAG